jgi:hypothetical protein
MKKKILFGVLAVVLAIGLTIPMALVSAHEEGDPFVTDLLAGQFQDVGDVKVWNDGDDLYITYELTDLDWIITETHLYVGKNVAPTTAPGQFPYDDEDATSVSDTVVTYTIPLADIDSYSMQLNKKGKPTGVMVADGDPGVEPCNEIYIATHAVVLKETTTELVTNGGFEVPEVTHAKKWNIFDSPVGGWLVEWYGDSTSYGGLTRPDPAHLELHEGVNGWLTYEGDQYAELDTDWDGPDGTVSNEPASVEISQTLAACPGGLYTLRYAWSPRPSHSGNALEVLWDGSVIDSHSGTGGSNTNWILEEHEGLSGPASGTVTLAFRETGSPDSLGMFLDSVSVICTEVQEETAWGGGFLFEGRNNWAMHFPYHVQAVPCMTPSGDLTVTGTGWYNDTSPATAWCPCAYTYDLTDAGEPIALQGWVDLSEAAVANPLPDWSKYYAKFSMFDSGGQAVQVVFNNDYLGPWYEIPSVPWDRVRMENNMGLAQPERWYVTVGGTLGYDMDGYWVGEGNGATVYPSDGNYFFQLIADPVAETFTLQVYGMGSGATVAEPPPSAKAGWPKQNMYGDRTWLELGTITATGFDFSEVTICAELWASTQAGAEETTTIYWDGMIVDTPVTFGEIPE